MFLYQGLVSVHVQVLSLVKGFKDDRTTFQQACRSFDSCMWALGAFQSEANFTGLASMGELSMS